MLLSKKYFYIFLLGCLFLILLSGCRSCKPEKINEPETYPDLPPELAVLLRQLETDSSNSMAWNALATYYLKQEKFNEALHHINKALELSPDDYRHFIVLANIYLLMSDANRSLATLLKAADMHPMQAEVLAELGRVQLITKDYPRAIEYLKRALAIDKNNSKAYFWRAMYYLEHADTSKAVSDLQLAVAIDKSLYEGYLELGHILYAQRNPLAAEYLDHALQLAPNQAELIYSIGMAFQEMGRFPQAMDSYNRILSFDSTFYKAWYNLGYIHLVELDNMQAATRYFENAIRFNPQYTDAWYNKGLSHELSGNLHQAWADYKQCLAIDPEYNRAIEGLNRLDQKMN